ncbi:MAG: D-alanyl-D-alanine carboxypeptidase/D-alanyl-D-alanine-endopeptidase [Actinomycetota bacterium]|nr:D-alanyl-D-alanine carboxypeptidase/D-alanyl-D-alanine-endopeptidase [Actinomycetota bacterium]
MRRHLLPAILALLCVSSTAAALRAGPGADESRPAATVAAEAPVLTPRRVPNLLAQPVGTARLVQTLDTIAATRPDSACLVVTEGPRVLYDRQGERPLVPASGMKLLTATAVLAHLDPEEQLRTSVVAAGAPVDGVVEGDLWMVGGGDPVLGTAPWAAHFVRQPALFTPLEELAERIVGAGVSEVRGRIVGDESRYDKVRYVESWPERYAAENQIGPMSALSVNDGFADWELPAVAFSDPAAGAAGVLTALLRERGVVVTGEAGAGTAPAEAVPVASIDSPPVAELVADMLRESDNGTAELLLKELGLRVGGTGSTAAGRTVVADTLASLGLPTDGLAVVDGSGLDPTNQVTCQLLHDMLEDTVAGGPVDRGLAVAGSSGTLARRFLDTPALGALRAKTGSLRGVASLSGFVESQGGTELTFASIFNGIDRIDDGIPLQDLLGTALVRYPDLPTLAEIGPEGYGPD